jgi:DNA-binding NarL/FixJ family response regulator
VDAALNWQSGSVPAALRILIVDDHPAICDRLEHHIRDELPHAQTGTAPDLRHAFALATQGWDVVLLDINLPDGNGIEAFPALRAVMPGAAFILMTAASPDALHVQAISRLGAATMLGKSELFERLGDAIFAACATQRERDS